MHDTPRPPFLTCSWLGFRMTSGAAPSNFINHVHSRCHMVGVTARGSQHVRWVSRGEEKRWHMNTGAVNFFPRDGEQHTFLLTRESFTDFPVFLIPESHFQQCLDSDECEPRVELRYHTFHDDPVLQSYLRPLAAPRPPGVDGSAMQLEEAGRRLVLRLVELCGGGSPDWHADTSAFDRRTMASLVDYLDNNLKVVPSLSDVALRVGLSPSYFAKKFRQSTGVSLYRFVNLRRIHRSLATLKTTRASLAGVALDLGFASQSHFTRLFSGLTGMTPAKFRKQFRRTMG